LIRLKIRARGFAFDNPDFAFRPESHYIDPKATIRHKFLDHRKTVAGKVATHPARQHLARLQFGTTAGSGIKRNRHIPQT
jgi:hypothetical protein